jgi:hypothetical protein
MGLNLNQTQGNVFGQSGANHAPGLVPDPGSAAGTVRVLCENATFKSITAAMLPNIPTSLFPSNQILAGIEYVCDGGGSALTAKTFGFLEVPFNCTLNRVTLLADQSGSVVADIYKTTYALFDAGASHPVAADSISTGGVTISSATKAQNLSLSGWTTSFNAGDILAFVTTGTPVTITRLIISCQVSKT